MKILYPALAGFLGLAGCTAPSKAEGEKSALAAKVVGGPGKEGDLGTIVLSPEAEKRLGIRTARVTWTSAPGYREFAGDLILPAGRSLTVPAPLAGTLRGVSGDFWEVGKFVARGQPLGSMLPLLPLPRDLMVTARAEVEQAWTRVETAKLRMARAEKMLRDEVGTERAREDARNELELSTTAWTAAKARLDQIERAPLEGDVSLTITAPQSGMIRQVFAAPGQVVSGGAPLLEIADLSRLWIRAPIYAGEIAAYQTDAAAQIRSLDGRPLGTARPVGAPPTGDAQAATVDVYFEIPNPGGKRKPGEKVLVPLRTRQSTGQFLRAPWSAVLFDIHGGAWVYVSAGAQRYARRRVTLDHESGGMAYLRSGPEPDAPVVTAGAAELWGTEFGAGK